MPKGRGANERRRSDRQKRANWMNRHADKALMDRFQERRLHRMFGARKPRIVGRHPLERR